MPDTVRKTPEPSDLEKLLMEIYPYLRVLEKLDRNKEYTLLEAVNSPYYSKDG